MTEIEQKLLTITQEFISELNRQRPLNNLRLNATLEQDLGINSLGRIELFLRIEKSFAIHFEDQLMIEANTLNDIYQALLQASSNIPKFQNTFIAPLIASDTDPTQAATLMIY